MTTIKAGLAAGWAAFASFPTYRGADPQGVGTGAPTYTGTPGQGNTITITAGITGFGTKTQAAPVLWIRGSEVYENGVSNTSLVALADTAALPSNVAGAIFRSAGPDTTIDKNNLRVAELDQQIRGVGTNGGEAGYAGWPNAHLGTENDKETVPAGTQLYVSYRYKNTMNNSLMRKVAYTGLSGTFTTGSTAFDAGEDCTISGGVGTATVVYVDTGNSLVHLEVPVGVGSAELTGQTLTGTTASLSFDVPTDYASAASGKPFRSWQKPNTLAEQGLRVSHGNYGEILTTAYDSSNVYQGFAATTVSAPDPVLVRNTWKKLEYKIDYSGATGTINMLMDGTVFTQSNIDLTYLNANHGPTLSNFGLDQSPAVNTELVFGEVYMDTSFHRAVIGNASTWSAVTDFEELRLLTWTNSEITAKQWRTPNGLDTGWLYVIDVDDNSIQEDGVVYG